MTKEEALRIIREWKFYWMSKEPGYEERAFNIDSNMMHHLADKLSDFNEIKKG